MTRRIYICGTHSVGKTTLFGTLKKYLRVENAKLIFCGEVGKKICEEDNLTAKDFEDKEFAKKMLLQCLDDQLKLEENLEVQEAETNPLIVLDRSAVDYVNYLASGFGTSFGDDLLNAPDILKYTIRLRQDCIVFIIEPVRRFFVSDGIRAESVMNFDYSLSIDKSLMEKLNTLEISFIRITAENLQERFDFVVDEIFKRWPDMKRGDITPITDEDKPKTSNLGLQKEH